jgi:hypothetical protein
MNKSACARLGRSILATATLLSTVAATGAPVETSTFYAPSTVSCATPDSWSGAARLSVVMPLGSVLRASYEPPSIEVVQRTERVVVRTVSLSSSYRGAGVDGLQGAAKSWATRRGGLWTVSGSPRGLSQRALMGVLTRAGASGVGRSGQSVYFRAKPMERAVVLDRASAMLSKTSVRRSSASRRTVARKVDSVPVTQASFDVAMLSMQGRMAGDPLQFVDSLPSGVEVYPFGTSYVVRVPSDLIDGMWSQIDEQGERVLMVGASSSPVIGADAAQAIRFCGGSALMSRFPTPTVVGAGTSSLVVQAEGQRMALGHGDVLLVVQSPPSGRGVELALMRVVRR